MTEQDGVGRSPSEIFRAMLDERGVKYRTHGMADRTWFEAGNVSWFIIEREDGNLTADAVFLTPEQAIAITLGDDDATGERHGGAGTCHITVQDNMAETEGMGDVWLECDACHWQMPLEPSTPRFNYCPNCRRRVVNE